MERRRDIQIDDDPAFQRKGWMFERAGWVFLALLLVGSLLGVFGSGAFSSAKVENGVLTLEYQQVLRYGAPASLTIEFRHGGDGLAKLKLSHQWMEGATVERTSPLALPAELTNDGIVLPFVTDPSLTRGRIRIDFRPDRMGWLRGEIGLEGGPRLTIRSLVLP